MIGLARQTGVLSCTFSNNNHSLYLIHGVNGSFLGYCKVSSRARFEMGILLCIFCNNNNSHALYPIYSGS